MNIHPNGHTSSIQEFGGPFLGNIAWHDVKKVLQKYSLLGYTQYIHADYFLSNEHQSPYPISASSIE